MHPIANAREAWVGLWLRIGHFDEQSLADVFGYPGVFAALAPLDLIVRVPRLAALTPAVLQLLPSPRAVLCLSGAELAGEGRRQLEDLTERGYRVLVDVSQTAEVPGALRLYGHALNCREADPGAARVPPLCGPHLAYHLPDYASMQRAVDAGFSWLSGSYALARTHADAEAETASRKRVLALLGLLSRDASNHELETVLKQDPVLSYHLLRQVNSAAFAPATRVTSFGQAINLLGRRQLQRWLQLLLYAQPDIDAQPGLLLPLAALRAAQMEALSRLQGHARDAQDLAFMTGVFSLLDVLLGMPMARVLDGLGLPDDVAAALLDRRGELGALLLLAEQPAPDSDRLDQSHIDGRMWWESLLHAYHWAIQVAGNL
jgi:EAL and modified HD-GYP domain-containing signal transduction protein